MRLIRLALLLLCCLTGCSHHHAIVGKWRAGDTTAMIWEFSSDGAVKVGEVRGRYSFGDQQRVKIETPFATSVYQFEVSDDHMTLRQPNGSKLELTRIPEAK